MTLQQIAKDTCIVRNTAARKGRTTAVAPGTAASRYLHYGRIVLDASEGPLGFETNEKETGLIGLKGSAQVRTTSKSGTLSFTVCLLYTSPSPRDRQKSRMPSSA